MAKIYGKLNESIQTVIDDNIAYTPAQDEILMQGERPQTDYVASANGEWVINLDEVKARKIAELKLARDNEELSSIEYGGYRWDFDEKAIQRINGAIIALGENDTITWTSADNTEINGVNAEDLRNVVKASAVRSNMVHVKYRELRERVEQAETEQEVNAIEW